MLCTIALPMSAPPPPLPPTTEGASLQQGAPYSQLFLFRFEANLNEYGSYSLQIRMFRYIRKLLLFSSFASYSLQNIRTNLHANIRFDAKQIHFLILANFCFKISVLYRILVNRKQILHSSGYSGKYLHICIFTCKYWHKSKFSLRVASNYTEKSFAILDLN